MPLDIKFRLSDNDLEHFQKVMERAREAAGRLDEKAIVENASKLLDEVRDSDASDFILKRMERLETMIGMVVDRGWGLEAEDRQRVVHALAYFSEPEDLIPDHIPGLGFLDDAIMIELVTRELEHEIDAYRDFCVFRAAEASRLGEDASGELERADWLEERRKQLHSRMRRRKRRAGASRGERSPFSLL